MYSGQSYNAPHDLRVGDKPLRRAMVIGSCATGGMPEIVAQLGPDACPVDVFTVNHGCYLPETPPEPLDAYDFFLIQMPLRIVIQPEVDWMRIMPDDEAGAEAQLDRACQIMQFALNNALVWTRQSGVPSFVVNFLVPQQNPHGRFAPRYSLTNPVHFIERLNRALYDQVQAHKDAYVVDFDQVSATYGRKHVQDDGVTLFTHGSVYTDYDTLHDGHRLEPVIPMREQYDVRVEQVLAAMWLEAAAMFRTLRQVDAVKAVIVDLDDTLWRGVLAEADEITSHAIEGWPIGFVEALLHLKNRGILLAIVSKNDPGRVEEIWPKVMEGRLLMSDFAAVHIGWEPKPDGVARVLESFNILPQHAVFVDDNPVERSAVQTAFPGLRALGANPYALRRVLLWSPELQLPVATAESRSRTEMVRSQAVREGARKRLTQEAFLASVAPVVTVFGVVPQDGPRFVRSLELINKTNQFNTTGRRWTAAELEGAMAAGARLFAFEVTDKYTKYGLVGVLVAEQGTIVQMVMSCRVLGLGVELGALATLVRSALPGPVQALLVHTAANMPVRDLWTRAGFVPEQDGFALHDPSALRCPAHVKVVDELAAAAPPAVPEQAPTPPPQPRLVALPPQSTAEPPAPATTAWDILTAPTPAAPHARRRGWLSKLLGARQ